MSRLFPPRFSVPQERNDEFHLNCNDVLEPGQLIVQRLVRHVVVYGKAEDLLERYVAEVPLVQSAVVMLEMAHDAPSFTQRHDALVTTE